MTDHDKLFMAECVRQAGDIISQFDYVVSLNRRRTVAVAVAALVRQSDLKAGPHQRIDLVAPEIPALRPSVQKNN